MSTNDSTREQQDEYPRRHHFTPEERKILRESLEINPRPCKEECVRLASLCEDSVTPVMVYHWFQNRRQDVRRSESQQQAERESNVPGIPISTTVMAPSVSSISIISSTTIPESSTASLGPSFNSQRDIPSGVNVPLPILTVTEEQSRQAADILSHEIEPPRHERVTSASSYE
ncbi:hypothetical protein BJV82DRAFT_582336 [Fennellomyces sp. T-0311]|nr:hypothetical protein BJV82DRAFT_582336 [Fennellomyces sp. T-0311]